MRYFPCLFLAFLLSCATARSATPKKSSDDPLAELLSQLTSKDPKPSSLDGTLELLGPIDQESVPALMAQMDALKKAGAKQIYIRINSPGGSVLGGQILSQKIETLGIPVICIGDSNVMSMAFYVLQSCTERWATKRTEFMAHPPSDRGVGGNAEQLQSLEEDLQALSNAMAEHEAARLKISVKEFKRRIAHKPWFFNWDTALEVGAIDKVVAPKDIPPDIDWN